MVTIHCVSPQARHDQGSKWFILSRSKWLEESKKHSSLRTSLSKRAEKQALIRDNTQELINRHFARFAADVPGAQLVLSEAQSEHSSIVLHGAGMVIVGSCTCVGLYILAQTLMMLLRPT